MRATRRVYLCLLNRVGCGTCRSRIANSRPDPLIRQRCIAPACCTTGCSHRTHVARSPDGKSGPSLNSKRGILGSAVHGLPASSRRRFGIDIDKNVVYRVLAKHYRPAPGGTGPSWLSFIGQSTDSLWSMDLFRCESIVLRSYWVLVVMDQFTRRLVGIGVHCGAVTSSDLCRMFNAAIHGQGAPRHLSTDHDPLFEAHRWMANCGFWRSTKSRRCRTCPCPTRSSSA
jgi:transposase InsO family protein